jgi:hypothetical protein
MLTGNRRRRWAVALALALGSCAALVTCDVWGYSRDNPADPDGSDYKRTASPVFDIGSGTYDLDQAVTISCAGATIHYTTDGTKPTADSPVYSASIPVKGAKGTTTVETIKAIAISEGFGESVVVSSTYAITYRVALSFAPPAGTYGTDQTIAIDSDPSDASIYYTTDGSTPTTSSSSGTSGLKTTVAGSTTVSSLSKTIKAIATANGYAQSILASATYTIAYPAAATPSFSVASGTYTSDPTVTLSCGSSGARIYYTLDGTTPTAGSPSVPNKGAITVTGHGTPSAVTVKAMAEAPACAPSSVAIATYTLAYPAATPTFGLASGTYTTNRSVTLSCATAGASIYYTTNGSTPTTSSTKYTGAINVTGNGTTTIAAVAIASGYSLSSVASAGYTIAYPTATPTFSSPTGTYTTDTTVTLSCATSGATIYYTTDGTAPTTSSASGASGLTITAAGSTTSSSLSTTLEAIALAPSYSASATATATYTIAYASAAAPTFDMASGTYTSDQTVTISSGSSGAVIYYTTDGSAPAASSAHGPSPLTISVAGIPEGTPTTVTVLAMAEAPKCAPSSVSSAAYTIAYPAATPVFTPLAGTYSSDQGVTLSCTTPGSTIYYTVGGSTHARKYTDGTPISVAGDGTIETINAFAIAAGYSNSSVASATYTIAYP